MGREERRRQEIHQRVAAITKSAMDKGLIIEAGWAAFAAVIYPRGMSQTQHDQLRDAFFAGAQHLFGSIISALDPGDDPTLADIRRLDLINSELDAFQQMIKARHGISDDAIPPPENNTRN